jgi:integrase
MAFLEFERTRALKNQPEEMRRKLSSESLYLQIAALRAFYNFAEAEKFLPQNIAENLSLPRRWKRLPKSLSNSEIERLLKPEKPERRRLCDQAVLELAYASGCAWPNCAASAWNICIWRPAFSPSSAKATRSGWCPWAARPWRRSTVTWKRAGQNW